MDVEEAYWAGFNTCAEIVLNSMRGFEAENLTMSSALVAEFINKTVNEVQARRLLNEVLGDD